MGNRAFSFAALSLALTILVSASMSGVAQAQRAIVVTSTANDGPGTLRQALLDAVNGDTITFDPIVFPPDSPATITLTSALPEITQGNLTIDASNAGVILDGSALGSGDGFHITSNGNVIRGLRILYFPGAGVTISDGASHNLIGGSNGTPGGACSGDCNLLSGNGGGGVWFGFSGAANNTVSGNYIGTDASGTAVLGTQVNGIALDNGAQWNRIGGSTPDERNLISGNLNGVYIAGSDTTNNTVVGNFIGTDASGTAAIANVNGVGISNGARHNTIGGTNEGERNLTSGNGNGVMIGGAGTDHNVVIGNFIGTDVHGTTDLGNDNGVNIAYGAQQTVVGGDTPEERNIISGNDDNGIVIQGSGTMSNTVSGNYIGTDASGTAAIANFVGVGISNGAQDNVIGGTSEGERNLISGNESGVVIGDVGTNNNAVNGNTIGTNIDGTMAISNTDVGVRISGGAQYNVIGGDTAGERNLISGNGGEGVRISDSGTMSNTVSGNYIGTDASGAGALGNDGDGVLIEAGASHSTVGGINASPGGFCSGECNVISGDRGDDGVDINGGTTTSNTVSGNYIGTDVSGTAAIPNAGSGVQIRGGAHDNLIGGNTPEERDLISGNGGNGIFISGSRTMSNTVRGNYIGTDASGTAELGNSEAGVWISDGASDNTIGPGNVVAYNGQSGIHVSADEPSGATRNTLTQNAIYDNTGKAIDIPPDNKAQLPTPQITHVGFRTIRGSAPPNSTVELFSDDSNDAQYYEGNTAVDEAGAFGFRVPRDGFTDQYITATATDEDGSTSELSDPTSAQLSVLYELPGIPTPSDVSLEPEVIGINLTLALISVLFFGTTTMVFNSTLEKYSSEMTAALGKVVPKQLRDWLWPKTLTSRGQILRNWIALLALTSLIECFLDSRPLGMARLSVFLALFLAAIATSGLDIGSDLLIRRRLAPHTQIKYQTHWIGLIIAAGCVILSRAMDFQPGYLYGIVGALTLLPGLLDTIRAGKRALVVLLAVLGGGLLAWLLSPLLAPISADLEALLLTIFIICLQGVFFALLPIAVTDGGDIWNWNKWYWGLLATGVLFIIYHIVLFPAFPEVELLRQNSVQTVLVLFAIFGAATLGLWLLFPFRLRRARNE